MPALKLALLLHLVPPYFEDPTAACDFAMVIAQKAMNRRNWSHPLVARSVNWFDTATCEESSLLPGTLKITFPCAPEP